MAAVGSLGDTPFRLSFNDDGEEEGGGDGGGEGVITMDLAPDLFMPAKVPSPFPPSPLFSSLLTFLSSLLSFFTSPLLPLFFSPFNHLSSLYPISPQSPLYPLSPLPSHLIPGNQRSAPARRHFAAGRTRRAHQGTRASPRARARARLNGITVDAGGGS